MNSSAAPAPNRGIPARLYGLGLALLLGVLLALSGSVAGVLAVFILSAACLWFFAVCLRVPLIFAAVFLLVLETLPPFYFEALGDTPLYVSFLLLPAGLAIVLLRFPDMRVRWDPVAIGLALFIGGAGLSLPFAWWLSGAEAGMVSVSRWMLLAQSAFIYYLIRGGAKAGAAAAELRLFPLLMWGAVASAAYGIVDFIWPIPIPHPSADQFIWLEASVMRRAQGVFYESSSFANFCGFFLVAASTAFVNHKERYVGVPRAALVVFIPVFTLAVLVAFSRSTWASIAVALFTAMVLSRAVKLKRALLVLAAIAAPVVLLWAASPELWDYLVSARLGRLLDVAADPNVATSGRFDTWVRVLGIMREHPHYLLLGIGYKTLPVTRLFQSEIITDNGYLSLLLETGVVGISGFLLLSAAILRTSFRLAQSGGKGTGFWATVVFAVWCGELVQLLAADAFTYWRNVIILIALVALMLNLAERSESGTPA